MRPCTRQRVARGLAAWCLTPLWVAACAPAFRPPHPSAASAAADLMREADAAWARRLEPGQAAAAQARYLEAARLDRQSVSGLLGALRAMRYRLEREHDPRLAEEQVEVGQWCQLRAPEEPACAYGLAMALDQLVRERPATYRGAIGQIAELLRQVIQAAPGLDEAGAHRALALVLLRSPAWPLGPGDAEAGLAEAQAAVALFPESAVNQLVLAEALGRNQRRQAACAAYVRARALARAARGGGDPSVGRALADAEAGLERCAER